MVSSTFNENRVPISIIPQSEFKRIYQAEIEPNERLMLLADMNRANTIAMVKRAGSGHIGSSFSAMDIVTFLYYEAMNVLRVGIDSPDRDIYFSSKGHDAPGLYAVLYSLNILPLAKVTNLRRLDGLDGHPDKSIAGVEANTGSLGMGISKGKGMAIAKRIRGHGGTVYVVVGDGEFGEGQNFEALQSSAHLSVDNLVVIMDHNKLQSDKEVSKILDLRDLGVKLEAFGWYVERIDGHDFEGFRTTLEAFKQVKDKPKFIIADTIKGRGVSFMEHPFALKQFNGLYPWHAGAPKNDDYLAAYRELIEGIQERFDQFALGDVALEDISPEPRDASGVINEFVIKAYGETILELGRERQDLVVLDADLAADCQVRDFENTYPERFIENGIAEQDMVSTAAGLASMGMLPVVNSFASFLASRANEQIYNATTEKTKIIYTCNFGGLIPAGPGKSHQSLRDISLFSALPDMVIVQPVNAQETRAVVRWAVNDNPVSTMLRFAIGPSPRLLELPANYQLEPGKGTTLMSGDAGVLFAYGPVMMNEALIAGELLQGEGINLQVVNMPWLNRFDTNWLTGVIEAHQHVFVLDDHSIHGGLGDLLMAEIVHLNLHRNLTYHKFGLDTFPKCGTPSEVLNYHALSGTKLSERIKLSLM